MARFVICGEPVGRLWRIPEDEGTRRPRIGARSGGADGAWALLFTVASRS
ncbi:hypothetical protein OG864_04390 [Streptomyces sp. NBC_00124]|nr:hypothetical protein [Streptomyces sp. NBC_00124]MCX5357947.1 hypothetical protein [Streptomyces sp. NBC_00124]